MEALSREKSSRCAFTGLVGAQNKFLLIFLSTFPSARRALLIAAAIQPDSLEMVLVRLLVRK